MIRVAEVLAGELPRLNQAVGGVQQLEHLVKNVVILHSRTCKAASCLISSMPAFAFTPSLVWTTSALFTNREISRPYKY